MLNIRLEAALLRENNNYDLLRLVFACLVIVGHAHALVANDRSNQDLVLSLLRFDYSGSIAVKSFFFLSGLVVTNSIIRNPNILEFFVGRFFRIFPGLLICTLVSVLIIGPLFTSLDMSQYFSDPSTGQFLTKNLTLKLQYELPGVFQGNPLHSVNGSLWTLPFEVICYSLLVALALLSALKDRLIGSLLMICIIAMTIFFPALGASLGFSPEAELLPGCFAFGGLLAINKDRIAVRWSVFFGLCLLTYLAKNMPVFRYLLYACIFYGAIVFASSSLAKKIRLPGDYSYGVYIYGFPVQQMLVVSQPNWGVHAQQFATLVCAGILAVISWILVEKPAIRFGRFLVGRLKDTSIANTFSV
jgi:peptidoglycan/LPS O-acetylase OafA/YrhL